MIEALAERLSALQALPKGWKDGAGSPITGDAVAAVQSAFQIRPGIASGGIFPTEEGGIACEYQHGRYSLTLEALPCGHFELYGVEIDGSREVAPVVIGTNAATAIETIDWLLGPA